MKTIGLIGGMSWESSVTYYQLINRMINQRLGGLHSAKIILYSVDFQVIEKFQKSGEWDLAGKYLGETAYSLQCAGAECIVLCTNTMHKVSSQITDFVTIPFLHIADATISSLNSNRIMNIGLLGTKYTMKQPFYKDKLQNAGFNVLIPEDDMIDKINEVIFNELCKGIILPESRSYFIDVINYLKNKGAQGIILGCTEIGLLVESRNSSIPLYDTTHIHAEAAVKFSLGL